MWSGGFACLQIRISFSERTAANFGLHGCIKEICAAYAGDPSSPNVIGPIRLEES
jgi:hypothetical protein